MWSLSRGAIDLAIAIVMAMLGFWRGLLCLLSSPFFGLPVAGINMDVQLRNANCVLRTQPPEQDLVSRDMQSPSSTSRYQLCDSSVMRTRAGTYHHLINTIDVPLKANKINAQK